MTTKEQLIATFESGIMCDVCSNFEYALETLPCAITGA